MVTGHHRYHAAEHSRSRTHFSLPIGHTITCHRSLPGPLSIHRRTFSDSDYGHRPPPIPCRQAFSIPYSTFPYRSGTRSRSLVLIGWLPPIFYRSVKNFSVTDRSSHTVNGRCRIAVNFPFAQILTKAQLLLYICQDYAHMQETGLRKFFTQTLDVDIIG
jgi:hypothetical protein